MVVCLHHDRRLSAWDLSVIESSYYFLFAIIVACLNWSAGFAVFYVSMKIWAMDDFDAIERRYQDDLARYIMRLERPDHATRSR